MTIKDSEAHLRFSALDERLLQRDGDFAFLQNELDLDSQARESLTATHMDAVVRLWRGEAAVAQRKSETAAALAFEEEVGKNAQDVRGGQNGLIAAVEQLRSNLGTLKIWVAVWDCVILSDFLDILDEFGGTRQEGDLVSRRRAHIQDRRDAPQIPAPQRSTISNNTKPH
jgi:hypothetical protein